MPSRTVRELRQALTGKGFEEAQTHHEMYWLRVNGKRTSIRTRISHGAKEYGDGLLALMAKQLKLSRSQFEGLIDCPLTEDEYVKILVDAGHVTLDEEQ